MFDLLTQSAFWIVLFLLGMGSLFWLYARDLTRRSARLRSDGVDGTGTVDTIAARTRSIYFQSGIHFRVPIWVARVTYADATGRERFAEVEVSKAFGEGLVAGDVIPLRFLPTAPGVMEVEPGRYAQESGQVYMLAVIFLATAALTVGRMFLWP